MAARYVRIGQYPDYRDEIRGTLAEILALTSPNVGAFANPEDVIGCSLEVRADGKWFGASVGALTQAQVDALVSAGAMGKVAAGTVVTVDGSVKSWSGSALSALGGGSSTKRYRPRTARRIFQDGSSIQAVTAGQTVINQFNLSQQCASLEFVLENYGSTAVTYDKIAVKSVATHRNDGGSGGNTVLTYQGSQSITVPAATNPGTVAARPGRVVLDKINIGGIARTDSGSGYLFNIRAYSSAGGGGLTIAPTYSGLQTAGGLDYAGGTATGDFATNFFGSNINGNTSPALGFPIFTAREDISTVLIIGDSIVNGGTVGWTVQAEKALRAAGKKVNFVNFAQGGVDSPYFAYALGAALALFKPTHLVLPFKSINDTSGDAVSTPLSLAMDNIQSVADFGCNVFSFTTLAAPLYSSRNPYVVTCNAVLRAHGIKYADMYPLTVSVTYPDGDNSLYADGVHPNGTTYTLMANTFVSAFSGEV